MLHEDIYFEYAKAWQVTPNVKSCAVGAAEKSEAPAIRLFLINKNIYMKLSKENVPFTMVANEVLYRTDLSLKAKAIYAYLFSKPDDWDFSGDRMVREMKEGRKVVYSALKELCDANLLQRMKQPDGRMAYIIAFSTQLPLLGNRIQEPLALFGTLPKRHVGKRGSISKTYSDTNTDILTKKDSTPSEIARSFFSGGPEFKAAVDFFLTKAPKEFVDKELLKFVAYWTEPNKSGTKVRWEQQPTFEVKRRLATWFGNIKQKSGQTNRFQAATV